jgi:hypothetical protein
MTKVAAKKTAGVLGDDLALNAQQVSGVRAERELPVVWAVAKGSFINKLIIVPSALLLSVFFPPLILVLLMIGGAYLCYEGFEKVFHKLTHQADDGSKEALLQAVADPNVDLVEFEKQKIKGAIRTDFILSAEIIVIAMGTVSDAVFMTQVLVVSGIALIMTVGVYGLVAGIVKFDDAGIYLIEQAEKNGGGRIKVAFGRGLVNFAPKLMKFLMVVGTAAMFLVGGGILAHGIPVLSEAIHHIQHSAGEFATMGNVISALVPTLANAIVGIFAGGIVMSIVTVCSRLYAAMAGKADTE